MKRTNSISLLLGPVLGVVLACGGGGSRSSEPIERDVYASTDDCLKDWNTGELCERMNPDDERQYQQSHGITHPVYWGPHYYGSDRTVIYQGRTISPTSRSTTIPSYHVTSSSSPSASRSVSSPRSTSTTYGGFGGTSPGSSS